LAAAGSPLLGKLAFAGVFAAVAVWLLATWNRRGPAEGRPAQAWWRDPRTWAVVIALSQVTIYLVWG
jgi:hypothetical protein